MSDAPAAEDPLRFDEWCETLALRFAEGRVLRTDTLRDAQLDDAEILDIVHSLPPNTRAFFTAQTTLGEVYDLYVQSVVDANG